MREIKRYLKIYKLFIKNCLMAQMEYRINFITGVIVESGYLLAKALYAIVVYSTGVSIGGLSSDAILLFIGTYTMMTGIYMGLFYVNFQKIPEYVRDGSLDLYITKPISTQFMVTMRYFDFGMPIPSIIGGLTMIVIGWRRLNIGITPLHIIGFIGFMLTGILLTYSIFLLPQILSFWTVKTSGVNDISNALWDFNNMPKGIYSKRVQQFGTFVIPIFLISNCSPLVILDKLSIGESVWAISATILFFILSRFLFYKAMRNYSSASS
ncbi:ABC transporter permease [Cellulosilyticum ruminicola]|uniref:ABC transporter permease n=1 Tax=Cellulosilyticum ruminicola TaxID=425254 RepID=UPI001FA746C7|nr:ABC-2 family transporter protein [Cellulosilyticum ruminicola]